MDPFYIKLILIVSAFYILIDMWFYWMLDNLHKDNPYEPALTTFQKTILILLWPIWGFLLIGMHIKNKKKGGCP